jgi:hypothetical protein
MNIERQFGMTWTWDARLQGTGYTPPDAYSGNLTSSSKVPPVGRHVPGRCAPEQSKAAALEQHTLYSRITAAEPYPSKGLEHLTPPPYTSLTYLTYQPCHSSSFYLLQISNFNISSQLISSPDPTKAIHNGKSPLLPQRNQ